MFIDGRWVDAAGSRAIVDPGLAVTIATVPEVTVTDADAAVAAASRTFEAGIWHGAPADFRARVLWRIADLIDKR